MRKLIARMMTAPILASLLLTGLPVQAAGQEKTAAQEEAAQEEAAQEETVQEEAAAQEEAVQEEAAEQSTFLNLRLHNRSVRSWDEERMRYNYIGRYQTVELSEDCAKAHPELAAKLKLLNEGQKRYLENSAEGMIEFAGHFTGDQESALPLTETSSYLVRRADETALCMLERYDLYAGGEETTIYYTYHFDPETGKDLKLEEIVNDVEALPDLIADRMVAQICAGTDAAASPEQAAGNSAEKESTEETKTPEQIRTELLGELHRTLEAEDEEWLWVLDPQGLTFVFNPHTVDVEREDPLFVTILFKEDTKKEIFREEVREDSTYALYLPYDAPAFADLTGDGRADSIQVRPLADETEHYRYRGAEITLNGEHYFDTIYCEKLTPVLVRSAAGYILFLFFQTGEGGRIRWYSLAQGSPVLIDEIQGMLRVEDDLVLDWDIEDTVPDQILTDPDRMEIRSIVWLLSSYYGWNEYAPDREGNLVAKNPYYRISGNRLTLKKDLKVPLVDETTLEPTGRRVRIRKGTELIMKDSDGTTFVDFELPDGRLVRIEVEIGEYGEERVDGEDAYDVFDGMLYAG